MTAANPKTTPLSDLFKDAKLREIFRRAERDNPAPLLPVEPARPQPVLTGGAVVTVERELADA
jgi:hypothetical protein